MSKCFTIQFCDPDTKEVVYESSKAIVADDVDSAVVTFKRDYGFVESKKSWKVRAYEHQFHQ